jgi:hypothetical protein
MGQIGLFGQTGVEMPEAEIARRGGAVRWRTVKLEDGRVIRVAVVKKAGPRGGHTVAGPARDTKKKGTK